MSKWLCMLCGAVIEPPTDEQYSCCPECGTDLLPADLGESADIHLTWHELRILCFWAEFWASHCVAAGIAPHDMHKILYGICDRIALQHLDAPPLTFAGQISALRGAGFNIWQNVVPEADEL